MCNDPTRITVDWSEITTPNTTDTATNPLLTSCTESYNPLIGQGTFTKIGNDENK